MTENTNQENELTVLTTGAILIPEKSNNEYNVFQTPDGKFKRVMKYKDHSTITPTNQLEAIRLSEILDGDNVTVLNDAIGTVIDVKDVVIRAYDKLDEDTGSILYGATTSIIDHNGNVYATSSKVFMSKMLNYMKMLEWQSFQEKGTFVITPIRTEVKGSSRKATTFKVTV